LGDGSSIIVLGLVTTKRAVLESKDDLKRRIDEAARYVTLEQLCLSPQCGFASTAEGNALTSEDQVAKLRLVVETAHEVWGEGSGASVSEPANASATTAPARRVTGHARHTREACRQEGLSNLW